MILFSGPKTLDLTSRIAVVGILNATPDSYVAGSRSLNPSVLAKRAVQMTADGADIIEIGGESTGPDSGDVSLEEELQRILPVIAAIRRDLPLARIAIDTVKADVAEAALKNGVDMINDIGAGRFDVRMFAVIKKAGCPYVMMYTKDESPRTTKKPVQYQDVIKTIHQFLSQRKQAARDAGIADSQIIVDPGLGHFISSDAQYSHEIIAHLHAFTDLGPMMVSPSRKSFLAGSLNLPVADRLPATLVATTIAVVNGASFIRTHDVKETRTVVDSARL